MGLKLRSSRAAWVLTAVVMTLVAFLFYANLTGTDEHIEVALRHRYPACDPQFRRTSSSLLGPPVVNGNRVTSLQNGDQAFPAMLKAIRSAKHSVTFEGYIFWSGAVAQSFADAFSERARAGVPVHLVLDWLGSKKMDRKHLKQMRQAGVEIVRYRPIRWYNLDRMNKRTHRKILVVDGKIGFVGGMGIADPYSGNAQDMDHWRDSQYQFEGPVVAQLQSDFLDNWIKTGNVLLDGPAYFPPLDSVGPQFAQAFHSSPGDGVESLRLIFLLAISAATDRILIGSPYFVPNDLAVSMLVDARKRGVDVEIIVPGPILDAEVVRRASKAKWKPLLEAGVKIYEYQPTFYHTKVMVVDDCWVSVGSANFDNRSFRLNDEANINVLDQKFAREQARIFAEDRARSRQVTLEQWRKRPITERLEELVGRMVRHQL
ncbi:MAG TPA: cardiolipin synthase [Gemmatimonadales bacterium]|nr:cardiolipin synthase [Gemmatimonadales bacterium]